MKVTCEIHDMTVYIVLGDEARSDGDNIKAVCATREKAEEILEKWYGGRCGFSIEEFDIEE